MASHPLNYEPYPELAPSGGPEARESIHSDPDMFGAAIGRGLQTLGQGIQHADNEGFDVATMVAKQDDNSHANETNAWFAKQATDATEKFQTLRGKDAEMALPDYQKNIDGLRKQAIGQAGNPYTAQEIDNNTRQITDSSYKAAARHAATQKSTWDQNSTVEKAQSYGGLAAVHVTALPPDAPIEADPSVMTYLNVSDGAAGDAARLNGLDGDVAAQRNRGKNVETIVKNLISDGSKTSLKRAAAFAASQDTKIDGGSRATINTMVRVQEATYNGQVMADNFMHRGQSLPPGYADRTFQLESGGNPNAQTGSYGGLGQFSKALEARYGINDANRTDPNVQTRALSQENAENHDALAKALGHEPTPADYYLAHQQGVGGAVAHLSQPNLPAWQNMASTAEGHDKGTGWAKQAVWGNMTPEMKAQFPGGVETVTSSDFARMWSQRFYQQPIQAAGIVPGNGTETAGAQPVAMTFNRFAGAQDFSAQSKGEVINKIMNDPHLRDNPATMNAALTYTNKVFEAQTASYADMERQQHIVEQQRKLISEGAENDYLKQIYAPPAGAKPLSVTAIVNDDRLNRESKDRIIKLIGAPGEKDETTYGSGFVKAFQMVHAPDGTPGRITDSNQLYDRLGPSGDLTMAGVEKLRGEIDLKKSPEGEAESRMKKSFLDFAYAHITGSDQGFGFKDPKGDELYLKFQAAFWPAYEKARRDGKTPNALLDPNSSDYVAKGMLQEGGGFVRSSKEWTGDVLTDQPGDKKPPFDISKVKSPDELKKAYDNGDITPQQARAYAITKQWARQKPAGPSAPVSQ